MKDSVKKLILTLVAILSFVAGIFIVMKIMTRPSLVLKDKDSGYIYAEFEFDKGDTFSISFVHSVNQSEVVDYYKRGDNGLIVCYANLFHSFGAGMPVSWPQDAVIETTEDGILVSNLHMEFEEITYIVATVSDHIMEINGQTISLGDLCGKNKEVTFEFK